MKFDGSPICYDAPFHSGVALSPPDEPEDTVQIEDFLISSGYGIYIPQMFTGMFGRKNVPEWAWQTCQKGPDQEDYEEAWAEVLDTWEYFSNEGYGCTYRYFLQHEEDLCLMRQFISQEIND